MKKRILPLLLTLGIVSLLLLPYSSSAASTSSKIDQQLAELRKKQAEAKKKANEVESQISEVKSEKEQETQDMNVLIDQLNDAGKKLADLNNQIDTVSVELQDNAQQLDDAVERVESRDQVLKSRLRLMYMNGSVSYIDVLLSATSFSDFLNRLEALKSIVNQDKEILEANQKDRDTVAVKKQETETQLVLVQQLYAQADEVRKELQVKEKEKEVKIASLTKKEKDLEGITEENEKMLIQYAAQEATLQAKKRAEEAAAAEARARAKAKANAKNNAKGGSSASVSNPFSYSGGKFGYPLAVKAPLTSDFQIRVNPVTGQKNEFHKGIDLGAPKGTGILAAEDGVVIVASWWSGYGNAVVIDHGNGAWTLYGHIRNDGTLVKQGDTVKRGQKIAEVGSTGQSTGFHLHFEVRINEKPVDPKPYLR
ncbi:murein hydrolase activator EnvC family protein [Paenibacillus eucommiae]|uniref:Murein DD-endopeptidase MepM/ murein hydrolase activator NlpD n=1 Tax=Paenibacillus eucommiae TaxID=1355755 RepID=A0ABS4IYK9_9BACL|nr:M23 family metallopeptidase [Paenibacillus eucommiae]MBP1992672.1 murein DD-endopeptidase MepM/ murein hydrolase activator NlpD [Paenibacillus eucommiae]